MPTNLHSRLAIRGVHSPAQRGRLGLLAFDRRALRHVAVTAAQIVAREPAIVALESATQPPLRISAGPALLYLTRQGEQPAWRMLAVAPLGLLPISKAKQAPLLSGAGGAAEGPFADPKSHLGQTVLVWAGDRPRKARLISIQGAFRMPRPGGDEMTTFFDALKLRSLEEDKLVVRGDAGSVVTTTQGEPLGVIVFASGESVFAAPLRAFSKHHELEPLNLAAIDAHNRKVNGGDQLKGYHQALKHDAAVRKDAMAKTLKRRGGTWTVARRMEVSPTKAEIRTSSLLMMWGESDD